jgi:phosphoglycolate phosphatase
MPFRCLLFDLDGTLIDSRADLAFSVNLMLRELGQPALNEDRVIGFVGEGVRLLMERSLTASYQRTPTIAEVDDALELYLSIYRRHLLDRTALYPQVRETLEALREIPKAVVTNKPYQLTLPILEGLKIAEHFSAVLGGDSLPERKPAPAPLLEAARRCEVRAENCLMVGDTFVDIEAGRNAGMKTCGYVGGFCGSEELKKARADFLIEDFSELLLLVKIGK